MKKLFLAAAASLACMTAPAIAQEEAASEVPPQASDGATLLVYSATGSFRHDSIDEAWAALANIASDEGWTAVFTEDPSWFEPNRIAQFDGIIFASATGDTLSPSQRASFQAFVENGGGFVGTHGAGDGSHNWPWYQSELIGALFTGHPLNPGVRSGTIQVEDTDHPATSHLPDRWHRVDEWYSFDVSVRGRFHVLATMDEDSYARGAWVDGGALDMGEDHPIVWNRCVGEGRSFYSALGHTGESYQEDDVIKLITGGIKWSLGVGDCPDTE